MRRTLLSVTGAASVAAALATPLAMANDKLIQMANSDENWVMPGKDYSSDNYSKIAQINIQNVKHLRSAWSFSTGVLNGHEGTPLVINGKLYINTPLPNSVFALELDHPGKIFWQYKPKQDPTARAVACCDIVNRGLAYWPGDSKTPPLIFSTQLDYNIVALKADNGELYCTKFTGRFPSVEPVSRRPTLQASPATAAGGNSHSKLLPIRQR